MARMGAYTLALVAGAVGGLYFGEPAKIHYEPFAYVVAASKRGPSPMAEPAATAGPLTRHFADFGDLAELKAPATEPAPDDQGLTPKEAAVAEFICNSYGGDCVEIASLVALVGDTAEAHGIPAEVPWAIAIQESRFKPGAVNSKSGDYGLMQVNYRWHRDKVGSPRELLDPSVNVRVAMGILDRYAKLEKGDWHRALRRYNGLGGKNNYPAEVLARVEKLREVQRSATSEG